jgi:uncharacterized membrane protein
MATKYDTNPLDPDFPERVKAEAEALAATQGLGYTGAETRQFAEPGEEQTRRFAGPNTSGYAPPYTGQYIPANYQSAGFVDQSISRKVDKVGLPENVLTALPYIPWYIGMVAALLILLFVPKSEAKVRFHAAQGLAAHIGILIVTSILSIVGNVTGVARAGHVIFQVAMTVMLIIWAIKAWKGKPVHVESVDGLTNWLEEKITVKT